MKNHRFRAARSGRIFLAALLVASSGPASGSNPLEGAGPRPALARAQAFPTALELSAAVETDAFRLDLGGATLEVERGGIWIPASQPAGLAMELVLVGSARVQLVPGNEIESSQLALYADDTALDEPVSGALFVFGDAERARQVLRRGRPVALDEKAKATAEKRFRDWAVRDDRQSLEAGRALFCAAAGDARCRRYVGAWLVSEARGDLFFESDPREEPPVRLGRLRLLEDRRGKEEDDDCEGESCLGDEEQTDEKREWKEKEAEEPAEKVLRADEFWVMQAADPGEAAGEAPRPFHYEMDVRLDPEKKLLEGRAMLRFRAIPGEQRVVELELAPRFVVDGVEDAAGHSLSFWRSMDHLDVALPTEGAPGEEVVLQVRWHGKAFRRFFRGIYALRETTSWYPQAGATHLATYAVTYHWPNHLQLFGCGRVAERGEEEGGRLKERRLVEIPTFGVTFEVGEFHVTEEHIGHIDLRVGFTKHRGAPIPEIRKQFLDVLKASLLFYETQYGLLGYDRLEVVTMPGRAFSQSPLGFITFAESLMSDTGRHSQTERIETLAHEVSHQWWGHKLGWASDRDQWLSEALADFSAVQLMTKLSRHEPVYLTEHARNWRESLAWRTSRGRRFDSLGPVVLGRRLGFNEGLSAYKAVIYDKGSVVFSMLARLVGAEKLTGILRTLCREVDHGTIATEHFLARVEELGQVDLGPFATRFIYGATIPEVYYQYRIEPLEGGRWAIDGTATLVDNADYRVRLRHEDSSGWNLLREAGGSPGAELPPIIVPFQVAFKGAAGEAQGGVSSGFGGTVVLGGRENHFRIPLDRDPEGLWLDQRGEVLAQFFDENRQPKRYLRYRAEGLAATGDTAGAIELLRQAIAAPLGLGNPAEPIGEHSIEGEERFQNVMIRLALARMYLERFLDADAERELASAEAQLGQDDRFAEGERVVLRSRLDIERGEFRSAYRRLNDLLRFREIPVERQLSDRQKRGGWLVEHTEAFALFAVAAYETGRHDLARDALERSEERGADMAALRALLPRP